MRNPMMPLHLIAETTPGMHPWETIPGEYHSSVEARDAARALADQRGVKVHVNDKRGHFWFEVRPAPRQAAPDAAQEPAAGAIEVCDICAGTAVQRPDGAWIHAEYADAVFCSILRGALDITPADE